MHALRHWFASVQLDGGTSVRALSEYLGHVDPGFTLRIYTHLMPKSEDRAGPPSTALENADAATAFHGPATDQEAL
jgi:hypothetical protein